MAGVSKTGIFNVSLATLAGGAAGFAVYAMPAYLLENLIGLTGLPNMMTAAQPPLGSTARMCLVAAAAVSLSLLVWLVLRAFDPPAAKVPARNARHAEADSEDLWDPAPREIRAPAPVPQPLRAAELDDAHLAAADVAEELPADDTLELDRIVAEEPIAQPSPRSAWNAPAAPDWDADPLPAWDSVDEEVAWESAPVDAQVQDLEQEASTEALLARLPSAAGQGADVASLVQRLNAGLAENEWPVAAGQGEPQPPAEMDDRLRSVLHDLHKIAGSNG